MKLGERGRGAVRQTCSLSFVRNETNLNFQLTFRHKNDNQPYKSLT